jgi:hypothetical protein
VTHLHKKAGHKELDDRETAETYLGRAVGRRIKRKLIYKNKMKINL